MKMIDRIIRLKYMLKKSVEEKKSQIPLTSSSGSLYRTPSKLSHGFVIFIPHCRDSQNTVAKSLSTSQFSCTQEVESDRDGDSQKKKKLAARGESND
jgi:hypothetical protein